MISLHVRRAALRRFSSLNDLARSSTTTPSTGSNGARHISQTRQFSTTKVAFEPTRSFPYTSTRNAATATATKTATPIKLPVGRPTPSITNNSRLATDAPPSDPSTSLKEPSPSDLTDPANRRSLTKGLLDTPPLTPLTQSPSSDSPETGSQIDWSTSFQGLSNTAFSQESIAILLQPVDPEDVEIKPDGIIYLPEIKYRRILNRAFGPGAWGLAPRGETIVTSRCVTREYGLVVHGRLVSIARGEQQYFDPEGIPTATEGCKSNALMRCCKDLGIASELWDPVFVRKFMAEYSKQVWVEHVSTKKRKLIVMRKDVKNVPYPFKEAPKAGS